MSRVQYIKTDKGEQMLLGNLSIERMWDSESLKNGLAIQLMLA